MILDKIFKRKEILLEEEKVVEERPRYAIQYKMLTVPFYTMESFAPCVNAHELDCGDIGELWTVIEDIGDRKYVDLITGEIYTGMIDCISYDRGYVYIDHEDYIFSAQEKCLASPLSLGIKFISSIDKQGEISVDVMDSILKKSLPRLFEITSTLDKMRMESIEFICKYFEDVMRIRVKHLAARKLYEINKQEDKRKNKEEEETKFLEKQLEKQDREAFEKDVKAKFAATFPKVKTKSIK